MLTESYSKGAEYPELSDLTLGQLLHQAAHKCPDRAAIIAGVADPSLRMGNKLCRIRCSG